MEDTEPSVHASVLASQRRASSSRTAHRVTSSTRADRDRLGDLDYVTWLVAGVFSAPTALKWWTSPSPSLDGACPADRWFDLPVGREQVVAAVETMSGLR